MRPAGLGLDTPVVKHTDKLCESQRNNYTIVYATSNKYYKNFIINFLIIIIIIIIYQSSKIGSGPLYYSIRGTVKTSYK